MVMAMVLTACGGHAAARLAPGDHPPSPSTGIQTTAPQPAQTPTPPAQLQVLACHTNYGVQGAGPASPNTSSSVYGSEGFPASLASQLSVYQMGSASGSGLGLAILVPSGLQCTAIVGADGNQTITATSPADSQEGVEMFEGNGFGPSASEACPFFPQELDSSGLCFGGPVVGEQIHQLSPTVIEFVDPPGIKGNGALSGGRYADDGLSVWVPSTPGQASYGYGVQVDCALPLGQKDICTAVLNYVSYWYSGPR